MGRIFRCPVENQTIANSDGVLDIFELIAGANDKLLLHKFRFESDATAAESVRLRLVRRSTTGSGGSAGTEVKNDETDSAPTASCTFDVTTAGTPGDVLNGYMWEQLGPLEEIFLPEDRPVVQEGGRICLEVAAAIATDSNMSGYVVWEEL